jgi:antitoxin (DNA-binding transcriptional repressor) of toxin-antitoxin stability system
MTATIVPAEVPISEARAILTDIATAAKEHGAQTVLTKHGKAVAKVVHPDAGVSLVPERVDRALRAIIADLDYDLHKSIECGEETGEDTYYETVAAFIAAYGEETP